MANIAEKSEFTCNFSKELSPFDRHNFPVSAFPKSVQKIIAELDSHYNFSPAYQAAGILSAAATIIGCKMAVVDSKVMGGKPVRPTLFFVNIGVSGTGKSPSREWYYDILNERMGAESVKHQEGRRLRLRYAEIPKGRSDEEKTALDAKRNEIEAQYNALAIGGKVSGEAAVQYPYIIDISQTTYESIIKKFSERYLMLQDTGVCRSFQHGILLASSELHGTIKAIDRYESNLLTGLNTAWDFEPLSSMTLKEGMLYGNLPNLVLAGDLQFNKPLRDMYRAENTNSGFAQRLFAAAPPTRSIKTKANPNEARNKATWAAIIEILDRLEMRGEPIRPDKPYLGKKIPLTNEGAAVYNDFLETLHLKQLEIDAQYPNAWQKSAISKGKSSVVRLALILEMLDFAEKSAGGSDLGSMLNTIFPSGIGGEAMKRALMLFDYYMNTNDYLSNLEQSESEILPNQRHRDFIESLPDKFSLPAETSTLSRRTQERIMNEAQAAGIVKKLGKNKYQKS
jgi:hypothetical protein